MTQGDLVPFHVASHRTGSCRFGAQAYSQPVRGRGHRIVATLAVALLFLMCSERAVAQDVPSSPPPPASLTLQPMESAQAPVVLQQSPSVQTTLPAPAAKSEEGEDRWGIGAHPIFGFEPEASWTFGAGGTIYYNIDPLNPEQRLDEYTVNATYSLRNQGTLSFTTAKYIIGNELHLKGELVLMRSTGSYYGIGPNTPDSAEEEYMRMGIQPNLALLFQAAQNLSIGPKIELCYSDLYDIDPEGALANDAGGSGQSFYTGVGLMVSYNSTNRKLYKVEGTRADLSGMLYPVHIGTSRIFSKAELDVRHYVPLAWGMVLALQVDLRSSFGDVPFLYMETLGAKRLLRGYSSERYLDRRFVGAQVELRYPIFWRFGGTAFFGAAEVEDEITDMGERVRAAGGLGLRIALNRSQTINLRFDFALNSDGEFEKYIKLGEAF